MLRYHNHVPKIVINGIQLEQQILTNAVEYLRLPRDNI